MIMVMSRLFGIDISFVILLSSMVACWGIEGIWSDVEFEVGAIVVYAEFWMSSVEKSLDVDFWVHLNAVHDSSFPWKLVSVRILELKKISVHKAQCWVSTWWHGSELVFSLPRLMRYNHTWALKSTLGDGSEKRASN